VHFAKDGFVAVSHVVAESSSEAFRCYGESSVALLLTAVSYLARWIDEDELQARGKHAFLLEQLYTAQFPDLVDMFCQDDGSIWGAVDHHRHILWDRKQSGHDGYESFLDTLLGMKVVLDIAEQNLDF